MKNLELHPIAKLFPRMSDDDFQGMINDIQKNGMKLPILIHQGKIIDGRHRWEACKRLGIECPTQEWNGKDPWLDAQSLNFVRRHLPKDQIAAVLLLAAKEFPEVAAPIRAAKEEAANRKKEAGKTAGRGRPNKNSSGSHGPKLSADIIGKQSGVSGSTIKRVERVEREAPELLPKIANGEMSATKAIQESRREKARVNLESVAAKEAKAASGVYDVIVIDPPWPMQKIERDVRPNQSATDYPTMTVEGMRALEIPFADKCHVWLWTTHKFLPLAFGMLEHWGLKYVCTFVWHKPGGFQPYGLPQYNCEFALYARRGSPEFLDTKAFPVCFDAPRGAHSEKPEVFYGVVRRVTGGRRLDMFARRQIDGFDGWGKEAK